MEYKGLLARLAEFFTEWNKRHAPANRVNCLRIEMTDHKINYVFNGQILCQISIDKARQMEELDSNPIKSGQGFKRTGGNHYLALTSLSRLRRRRC